MIRLQNVNKKFTDKTILNDYSLIIKENDFLGIYGASGSGKTTLLNICSLLEKQDSGDVVFEDVKNPNRRQIQKLRQTKIGYLFQNYGLIENETVEKNLAVAFYGMKMSKLEKHSIALEALKKVGLSNLLKKKIYVLSGGEQQRVALARLLIKKPKYIFADEPTGNLDRKNAEIVFDILQEFVHQGTTVLFVSHDEALVRRAKTIVELMN